MHVQFLYVVFLKGDEFTPHSCICRVLDCKTRYCLYKLFPLLQKKLKVI